MKWIYNEKKEPQINDVRYVMKFAWFPVICSSYSQPQKYRVWLQYYKQLQKYVEVVEYLPEFGELPESRWVGIENYIP